MESGGEKTRVIFTAHQPSYLPWLGLFAKIAKADVFAIFDVAQFERHSFENRNSIRTHTGRHMLTVPVELNGHMTGKASGIRIATGPWARKHVRSIELAYQKAPFFKDYFEPIAKIIGGNHEKLHDLNNELLFFLLRALNIKTKVVKASAYYPVGEKSGLVLDLCRKLGATTYIFGENGRDYADVEAFTKAGVKVEFQDYRYPTYPQIHGGFEQNLSVIDLLFNHGPKSLGILNV